MRVLFSSTSGHGHVRPMIPLAQAFRAGGHDVLWATAAQATTVVTAVGIEAIAAGAGGSEEQALRGSVLGRAQSVAPDGRAAFVFPRMFGEALTPPMAADLLRIVADWKPDLLVHEHAELAAPLVGAVCGLPSVTHSFGTAIPVPILVDTGARLAGLWREQGLDVPAYAGCFAAGYLDICPPSVQSMPVDHIPDRQLVQPAQARVAGPAVTSRPLVYVTMGTVANLPDLLREVIDGVAALPVRVLVAVGPRMDPEELGDQPRHVEVEHWVDQDDVLDRCAAVVSHGGSGTFLAALARGLPQLCLPQAADQFRNAEGGERAGASMSLRPHEVTAEAVRDATESLLAEPGVRDGARRVAAEIASMPTPASVVALLTGR